MRWYQRIIGAHTSVTDAVSHGHRMQSDRYFVWQEDGANDFEAGNRHAEKARTGTTDLFTRQEFDPWVDALGEALSGMGIAWYINMAEYEEDSGFWHTEWVWEVYDGSDDDTGV